MTLQKILKQVRVDILVNAIISIVVGLMFIIWPNQSMSTLAWVIGILLIVYSIIDFIAWLSFRGDVSYRKSLAIIIVELIFGILIICNIDYVVGAFGATFAFYMIVVSAINLQESIYTKKFGFSGWFLPMILSILAIGAGIYLLINLRASVLANAIIIGIGLILQAASGFYLVVAMEKLDKAIR